MKEKYCLAASAPILAAILPTAIAAIERIYDKGSHNAVLMPGPTNFKYGSMSEGFKISSEMLPITWQAPSFNSDTRPLKQ